MSHVIIERESFDTHQLCSAAKRAAITSPNAQEIAVYPLAVFYKLIGLTPPLWMIAYSGGTAISQSPVLDPDS